MGKIVGIAVALLFLANASIAAPARHKHHHQAHHHRTHHAAHHAPG